MEKTLTAAARVRRAFKSGRPAKVPSVSMSLWAAMEKISTEAGRAKDLMQAEGLDPNDIECALMLSIPGFDGWKYFPEPGSTFEFFDEIRELGAAQYLGIMWRQIDRESDGPPVVWVTQLMGGAEAEKKLLAIRDAYVLGGSKLRNN